MTTTLSSRLGKQVHWLAYLLLIMLGAVSTASTLQPPDGRWLTDAQGRQYYLAKLPRNQGRRLPDGSFATAWGVPVMVEREDGQFFYYKVFRPPPESAAKPAQSERKQRALVENSYRVKVPSSSRLRFEPFGTGLPTKGQWRNGFAVADMNGDGHRDVVHGSPRKRPGPPVIFLGNGKGSWQPWRDARFPEDRYDYGSVAVADLNGDRSPDIALGMHLLGLLALTGDGKGGFRDASAGLDRPASSGPGGFSTRALRILDWDKDGHPDILALGEGPNLTAASKGRVSAGRGLVLYRGSKDGKWQRVVQPAEAPQIFGPALATGDFNADGWPDAVTGSAVQGRTDLVHLGTPSGGWRDVRVATLRSFAYVWSVAVADFDGDKRDDFAAGYMSFEMATWRSGIDVFYSRPSDQWERRPLAMMENRTGIHALAAGDLDGDGDKDLVALTGNGEVWAFPGDGEGSFTRERGPIPAFPGGCRGSYVALADLDGDHRDEIVASFAQESDASAGRCPSGGGMTAVKGRVVPPEDVAGSLLEPISP